MQVYTLRCLPVFSRTVLIPSCFTKSTHCPGISTSLDIGSQYNQQTAMEFEGNSQSHASHVRNFRLTELSKASSTGSNTGYMPILPSHTSQLWVLLKHSGRGMRRWMVCGLNTFRSRGHWQHEHERWASTNSWSWR